MTRLGALSVHWEVVLVAVGIGVLSRPAAGVAFVLTVFLHELGHALVAATLQTSDRRTQLRLQLGSGEAYLSEDRAATWRGAAVLLSGAIIGGPLAWGLGGHLVTQAQPFVEEVGRTLRGFALLWTAYQLSFLPVADGGALLRRGVRRWLGPIAAWRLAWLLGGLLGVISLSFISPVFVLWLGALAVVLGRSEAGHVRAVEAYGRLDGGDARGAIDLAVKMPLWSTSSDRARVAEVGLHAALQLEDVTAAERLVERLSPIEPLALEVATWLMRQDRDVGALVAERAHDRVDRGRAEHIDAEHYLDLTFYHAIHEATRLRPESSLGLLERALELGFDDRFRIEAEGAFDRVREHPRYLRVLESLPAV